MKKIIHRLLADPLFRHSVMLMAAAQVANVCNLLFQILMNRKLPDAEYGVLAAMFSLTAIVMMPLESLRSALAHRTALLVQEGAGAEARTLVRCWQIRLGWLWGVVVLVAAVGAPALVRQWHMSSPAPIYWTAVGLLGVFFVPVFAGVFQGMQRFGSMALVQQLPGVLRFLLGIFAVMLAARAANGVAAQSFAFVCSAALGAWIFFRLWRGHPGAAGSVRMNDAYFARSLLVLSGFAAMMMCDVILVKQFFDAETAGRYARAATIARAVVYLPMPVAFALFPKVVSRGERSAETRRLLLRALAGVTALLGAGVTVAWLLSPLLWRIFTGNPNPEAGDLHLLRMLLLALTPLAFAFLLLNFELAQHRFGAGYVVAACAVAYVAALVCGHASLEGVVRVLGMASGLSLAVTAVSMIPMLRTGGFREAK